MTVDASAATVIQPTGVSAPMPMAPTTDRLDGCHLTTDEMAGGQQAWARLEDDLPEWELGEADG